MRSLFLFILAGFFCLHLNAQSPNPQYQKTLADSLGGDDYGMKKYVLVILKAGDKKYDQQTEDSLFRGHIGNIVKMASKRELVVSGPLGKNDKTYQGIFILNVTSIDAAKTLLQADPAITAGTLAVEYYQWYGSAALPEYLPYHEKIQKINF